MSYPTVQTVLTEAKSRLQRIEDGLQSYYRMDSIYKSLSIFDWWKDRLYKSDLEDMIKFLTVAQELGYDGYCCFKVGVSGCANGMWAHKELSSDGFSPDGDFLYKSFTPATNYWSFKKGDQFYPDSKHYDAANSVSKIKFLHQLFCD